MCLVSLQGESRTQGDTRKGDTNMYGDTEGKTASQSWRPQKKPCPPTPLFTRLLGSSTVTKEVSVAQVTPAPRTHPPHTSSFPDSLNDGDNRIQSSTKWSKTGIPIQMTLPVEWILTVCKWQILIFHHPGCFGSMAFKRLLKNPNIITVSRTHMVNPKEPGGISALLGDYYMVVGLTLRGILHSRDLECNPPWLLCPWLSSLSPLPSEAEGEKDRLSTVSLKRK